MNKHTFAEKLHACVLKNDIDGVKALLAVVMPSPKNGEAAASKLKSTEREGEPSPALTVDIHSMQYRSTALEKACEKGHSEIAALLLTHGADIDRPSCADGVGDRPIHRAIRHNHADIVRMLVTGGQTETFGGGEAHSSSASSSSSPAPQRPAFKPCDVNAVNKKGKTPLHLLVSKEGGLGVIRLLVEAGADVSGKGSAATSDLPPPLMAAIRAGREDNACLLVVGACCGGKEEGGESQASLEMMMGTDYGDFGNIIENDRVYLLSFKVALNSPLCAAIERKMNRLVQRFVDDKQKKIEKKMRERATMERTREGHTMHVSLCDQDEGRERGHTERQNWNQTNKLAELIEAQHAIITAIKDSNDEALEIIMNHLDRFGIIDDGGDPFSASSIASQALLAAIVSNKEGAVNTLLKNDDIKCKVARWWLNPNGDRAAASKQSLPRFQSALPLPQHLRQFPSTRNGNSPLHCAIEQGSLKIIEALLSWAKEEETEENCNGDESSNNTSATNILELKNNGGQTPLQLCVVVTAVGRVLSLSCC